MGLLATIALFSLATVCMAALILVVFGMILEKTEPYLSPTKFCRGNLVYSQYVDYCDGKPFVCSEDKCDYVKYADRGDG